MYLHNGNDRIGSTTLSIAYERRTNAGAHISRRGLLGDAGNGGLGACVCVCEVGANLSALLIHSDNTGH